MNCVTLANRTTEAIKKLNINAEIEKVIDYNQILSYGIVRTPGLVIDGKVVIQGRVPAVSELQDILKEQIH
jgi:small redox-active disulfide protein 2